jgi:Calcium-dependent channel, 7TM region, putative phosphate
MALAAFYIGHVGSRFGGFHPANHPESELGCHFARAKAARRFDLFPHLLCIFFPGISVVIKSGSVDYGLAQVTVGLSGAAGALLQIVGLVLYYIFLFLLGSTPRKIYNIKMTMDGVNWGTLFPSMTILTVNIVLFYGRRGGGR